MKRTTASLATSLWISPLWSCHSLSNKSAPSWSPLKSHSRLFVSNNGKKSYVPDGLTPDEYRKIKQQESDRLKNMNFGMFGPRFRQSERPDGDWFLTPSLWTTGFKSNVMSSSNGDNNGDSTSVFKRVAKFGKKYAAAYFLAFVAVDMLLTMATTLKAVETTKWGLIKAGLILFVLKQRKQLGLVIWKTNTIKCIVAGVLTYPWQLYIEHANRKWQASKRQTVITTSIAMLAVSVLWSLILVGLRRSFGVLGG